MLSNGDDKHAITDAGSQEDKIECKNMQEACHRREAWSKPEKWTAKKSKLLAACTNENEGPRWHRLHYTTPITKSHTRAETWADSRYIAICEADGSWSASWSGLCCLSGMHIPGNGKVQSDRPRAGCPLRRHQGGCSPSCHSRSLTHLLRLSNDR